MKARKLTNVTASGYGVLFDEAFLQDNGNEACFAYTADASLLKDVYGNRDYMGADMAEIQLTFADDCIENGAVHAYDAYCQVGPLAVRNGNAGVIDLDDVFFEPEDVAKLLGKAGCIAVNAGSDTLWELPKSIWK